MPGSVSPTTARAVVHLGAVGSILAVVTWLLLTPDPYVVAPVLRPLLHRTSDYILHTVIYFGLTLCLLSLQWEFPRLSTGMIVAFLIAHACLTETCQAWVPGRSTDVTDFVANVIGITLPLLMPGVLRLMGVRPRVTA